MARKSPLLELLTAQAEQDDWGALEDILLVALDQEVQLTPGLAKILLAIVRGERTRKRGQPAISVIVEAVMYSVLLELEGLPIKAAILDTSELFGVSRSSIYTARKRMPTILRQLSLTDTAMLDSLRQQIEARRSK